jgi:sulfate adenylyltransferase subunit 2
LQDTDRSASNPAKHQAVLMRESGLSASDVAKAVGLSAPTVLALHRAFKAGGWDAVNQRTRGRPRLPQSCDAPQVIVDALVGLLPEKANLGSETPALWSFESLAQWLAQQQSTPSDRRSVQRRMGQWGWLPEPSVAVQTDTLVRPKTTKAVIQAGTHTPRQKGIHLLWARDARGALGWLLLAHPPTDADYRDFAQRLLKQFPRGYRLQLAFAGATFTPLFNEWLQSNSQLVELTPSAPNASLDTQTSPPTSMTRQNMNASTTDRRASSSNPITLAKLTHLQRLEAESIHIMREVVASCDNPVMLYSIGKDSAVMLHLALKAFYPAKLPFPLLHVDTGWKFRDMYAFRDRMQAQHDFKLLVHQNPEGLAMGINPFTHGSQIHTDIMKTQGLKQALDQYQFDAAFGGARRDEEKSRAKERIFSFRSAQHRWDPKNQRPELWNLYNTHKNKGESLRVFPISNWTELDIWQYIYLENIPIVPLYFSQERPVVERDGALIMVDDERMPLRPGEVPMLKNVRFRTLGCYPLTGAVASTADTLPQIIQEMLLTTTSERQGRVIDHDSAASMEKKKQEGYF